LTGAKEDIAGEVNRIIKKTSGCQFMFKALKIILLLLQLVV